MNQTSVEHHFKTKQDEDRWFPLPPLLSSTLYSSLVVWVPSQEYKYYATSNAEPRSL